MTIAVAELLSIGTELTVGETRDTNAGELARDLVDRGVVVRRMTALPDDLPTVRDAFGAALDGADLVVSTGGLGPTPDDLTREAIAALLGETPEVDPELDRWLRGLFERRGIPFPEANRKQAWLIPSAVSLPNPSGTAPGWLVAVPSGGVIVALPGPPREMRPMWRKHALPALEQHGLGEPSASVTLRLAGIGESAVADRLGPLLEPGASPAVATYARADAVDVRIWAGGEGAALVEATARQVEDRLQGHVWARGRTTWAEAIAASLDRRGWRLAIAEAGLRGALVALLGEGLGARLVRAEVQAEGAGKSEGTGEGTGDGRARLEALASGVRASSGAEIGLAAAVRERGGDTVVSVAIEGPAGVHHETRVAFLGGDLGRGRAAVAAAAILLGHLERPRRKAARPATVSRT